MKLVGNLLKLLSSRLQKQQADKTVYKTRNPDSGEIETSLERIQQSLKK